MATDDPLSKNGKYDGARNEFIIDRKNLQQDARRLEMSVDEYLQYINSFVKEYSQNPLFAYQHTDLSRVPIEFTQAVPASAVGSYNPQDKTVRIVPSRDKDQMLTTLIHELSHAAADLPNAARLSSDRMNALGSSKQAFEFRDDPVRRAISYGPGETAAWLTQVLSPAFQVAPPKETPEDVIIKGLVNRHREVVTNMYSRTAQPTRPITRHPKTVIEMSLVERLLDLFTNYSGQQREPEGNMTYFAESDPNSPGSRYKTSK